MNEQEKGELREAKILLSGAFHKTQELYRKRDVDIMDTYPIKKRLAEAEGKIDLMLIK